VSPSGFRSRLVFTVVALVALSAAVLGVGAYAFASLSLRERLESEASAQAQFNIAVLAADRLSPTPDAEEMAASGLAAAFRLRGAETVVDFGDGDPFVSTLELGDALAQLDPALVELVRSGRLATQTATIAGAPYQVVAGRRVPSGPDFYFFFAAAPVEAALSGLATALGLGGVGLVIVAVLAAGVIARGVLRPVREASAAAARIGAGDLRARLPVASRDEFGQLAMSFNGMAASLERTIAELEAAQRAQRRFVADVSHELRTPVTALVNEAEMLRRRLGTLDREGRHIGELLAADVARLRALVEDLMEISRLDAGVEPPDLRSVDLVRLVEAVVRQRLPAAVVDAPDDAVLVASDPRRLERIVGNLVDNARQHAASAEVRIEVRREPTGGAVVRVLDRGPGVPPAVLPRLFDRFTKGDRSRAGGGSGLGLSIAREHAAALGGTLDARPRDGGGMAFQLRLP
jgi:signal transduction histidine kinase